MPLSRRNFLVTGSLAAGALATVKPFLAKPAPPADLRNWRVIREQFDLDPNFVHLGMFFLASHPRPVRAAIESYRKKLDANPFLTVDRGMFENPEHSIPERIAGEIAKWDGELQPTCQGLCQIIAGAEDHSSAAIQVELITHSPKSSKRRR